MYEKSKDLMSWEKYEQWKSEHEWWEVEFTHLNGEKVNARIIVKKGDIEKEIKNLKLKVAKTIHSYHKLEGETV